MGRNISDALFEALAVEDMTAKQLSQLAGCTEAQLSRFRNGGDIYSSVTQRLIDALPDRVYNQFILLLSGQEPVKTNKSDAQIADQILDLALQLKKSRDKRSKKELILVGDARKRQ